MFHDGYGTSPTSTLGPKGIGLPNNTRPVWSEPSQGQFCLHCGAWHGSLGLEPNPELYLSHLYAIFDEVERVLKDEGTLWVNIGTSMQNKNDVMIPERFAMEMSNPNWILKDNLSHEEKIYVLTELIKRGIL